MTENPSQEMPAAPVVLVHGLWMRGGELGLLARRLHGWGFQVFRFRYPSRRGNVAANGRALRDYIRGLGLDSVHLVGHSLGGRVILQALADDPGLPPGGLVLLGVPVTGSAAAGALAGHAWGRSLLGASIESGGLLDPAPAVPTRPTAVITGSCPVGLGAPLGRLARPHDGIVAETETFGIPGSRARLPVTHMGLVFSRTVAGRVAVFLRTARLCP